MVSEPGDQWLTIAQAAKEAGVAPTTIHYAINKKQLRHSKVGQNKKPAFYLIARDDLKAYMEQRKWRGRPGGSPAASEAYVQLAEALMPRGHYPSTTLFGKRLRQDYQVKRLVASYVVTHHLRNAKRLFLGDGSSSLWIMLALLEEDRKGLCVTTNNIAAANEWLLNPSTKVRLILTGGEGSARLAGVFGERTNDACREAAQRCDLAIMSLSAITYEKGPATGSPEALAIKRSVIPNARKVVLLADASKFREDDTKSPVFPGPDLWPKLRDTTDLCVISDLPAEKEPALQAEFENFRKMGERFITVSAPQAHQ